MCVLRGCCRTLWAINFWASNTPAQYFQTISKGAFILNNKPVECEGMGLNGCKSKEFKKIYVFWEEKKLLTRLLSRYVLSTANLSYGNLGHFHPNWSESALLLISQIPNGSNYLFFTYHVFSNSLDINHCDPYPFILVTYHFNFSSCYNHLNLSCPMIKQNYHFRII